MLRLQPANSLMTVPSAGEEAKLCASPVLDALENANEQFAGMMANFKVPLECLLDPVILNPMINNCNTSILSLCLKLYAQVDTAENFTRIQKKTAYFLEKDIFVP